MNHLTQVFFLVLAAAVLAVADTVRAQDPNAQLFAFEGQYLSASPEGTTELIWLPDGRGYMEHEQNEQGNIFYRVDPASGQRTPLFDVATVAAIRSAYKGLWGQDITGLPFEKFTFEHGSEAIKFAVGSAKLHVFLSIPLPAAFGLGSVRGTVDESATIYHWQDNTYHPVLPITRALRQ